MRWIPLILICLLVYIESVIFVHVASEIGVLMTLVLVVLTSCLGISLVKNQGTKNIGLIQQKIAAGESPAEEMIKSVALVLAGILLIIPGFFTDFLGLLLLLPPVQKLMVMRLMPHIKFYRPGQPGQQSGFGNFVKPDNHQGNTFEGEFQHKQDDRAYTVEDHQKSSNDEKDDYPKR